MKRYFFMGVNFYGGGNYEKKIIDSTASINSIIINLDFGTLVVLI